MTLPSDWPYAIRVTVHNIDRSTHDHLFKESKEWCEAKFGKRWEAVVHRDGSWCCFWCGPRDHAHYRFHFRNKEDAVMFALRWSE